MENRLHPLFVRWLEPAIAAAEGAAATPVALPANGESGASVGRLQLDLTQQTALRAALARTGRRNLIPGDLDGLFAKRVRAMTPAERVLAAAILGRILAAPEGAAWLARHERWMLVRVTARVRRLIRDAAPAAEAFAASLRGQVEIGCHLHQFGAERTDKLAAFLGGARVSFEHENGNVRALAFHGALDIAQFREFRRATRWGAANPRANESRHARIDAALRPLAPGA